MVAITGSPGAGKTTAGKHLQNEHGFYFYSGSDFLQTHAKLSGIELKTREEFNKFQRVMRSRCPTLMTTEALRIQQQFPRVCHDGIRNRLDVDAHRSAGGFIIAVEAPEVVKFKRTSGNSDKYPIDFDAWRAVAAAEDNDIDIFGQHTAYAIKNADITINNDGEDLHHFCRQVDDALEHVEGIAKSRT